MRRLSSILFRLAIAAGAGLGSPALAQTEWPAVTQDGLSFYGSINRFYLNYDDGSTSGGFFTVDNATDFLGSYIGMLYDGELGAGLQYSARLQVGITPDASNAVSLQNQSPGYTINAEDIWYAEVRFEQANGGAFYIGQGDMTGNLTEPDFSGTEVIAGPNVGLIAGDMALRYTDGTLSTRTIGESIGTYDTGRLFRLRYDTPTWNGLAASASVGWNVTGTPANSCCLTFSTDETYYSIQGSYTRFGEQVDFQAVLDFSNLGDDEYAYVMSMGYIHNPTGLNIMLIAANSTMHKHYFYSKLGINRDIFALGTTALSLEWYNNGNWAVKGAEAESYGISLVQDIDRANMQIYAAYRDFDNYTNFTTLPDENFETSEAFALGVQWTF